MLVLICNKFPVLDRYGHPTGKEELLVDYAYNIDTDKIVTAQSDHPERLGAIFNVELGEWVIYD